MENKNCHMSEEKLLQHLGNLRKMIVLNHELENLCEFVLHDLCSGPCAHISKAAYFINNPDFKILRGITGYHEQEPQAQLDDRWHHQKQFIASMKSSSFNQKVRSHAHNNFDRGSSSEKYMAQKLADHLEFENPEYHVWDLKHANHGLLIYEPVEHKVNHGQNYLHDSLYYLSFCPVF